MYSILVLSSAREDNIKEVQAKDYTWVKRVKNKEKGKQMRNGYPLPEGTWTKSPGQIAQELKQHSKDYDEAQRRLNFYVNRAGRNLRKNGNTDEVRLEQAREALKRAYGVQDKPKPVKPAKPVKPTSNKPATNKP
jgi:hypothetical protein